MNTFGYKSFSCNSQNLLSDFDDSFLSRCYTKNGIRNNRKLKDLKKLSVKDKQRFQDVRNKLFYYCVVNYSEIEKSISEVKGNLEQEGIFGRGNDTNSMILGILKHFEIDNYDDVKEYVMGREGLKKSDLGKDSVESFIYKFINEKFTNKLSNDLNSAIELKNLDFSYREIGEYLNEQYPVWDNEEKLGDWKKKGRRIGRLLKNLGLVTSDKQRRREGGTGRYIVTINKDTLFEIGERLEYSEKEENSVKNTNSTHPIPTSQSSQSSQSSQNCEECEECEECEDTLGGKEKEKIEVIKIK